MLRWGRPCHTLSTAELSVFHCLDQIYLRPHYSHTINILAPFFVTALPAEQMIVRGGRAWSKECDWGSREESSFIRRRSGELLEQAWLLDEELCNDSHTHKVQSIWSCLKVSDDNEFWRRKKRGIQVLWKPLWSYLILCDLNTLNDILFQLAFSEHSVGLSPHFCVPFTCSRCAWVGFLQVQTSQVRLIRDSHLWVLRRCVCSCFPCYIYICSWAISE